MEYRKIGRAGLKVSEICLGSMTFGGSTDLEEARRIVDLAFDAGINYIDTADGYSKGVSEEMLGKILKGKRAQTVIATKFFNPMGPGPNDSGHSRAHIMDAIENSLRRLQTDYVDIYYIHHTDDETPLEEMLRALDDLVHQGKVRYIGTSNFAAWQVAYQDIERALANYQPQIRQLSEWLLRKGGSLVLGVLQFAISIIIAGVAMLHADGGYRLVCSITRRISPERGQVWADMSVSTVRSVTNGVLGVAVIQAVLAGIGFFAMGVPHAGIFMAVVLVTSIIQVPALLIIGASPLFLGSSLDSTFQPAFGVTTAYVVVMAGIVLLAWPLSSLFREHTVAPSPIRLGPYLAAALLPALITPPLLTLFDTRLLPVLVAAAGILAAGVIEGVFSLAAAQDLSRVAAAKKDAHLLGCMARRRTGAARNIKDPFARC